MWLITKYTFIDPELWSVLLTSLHRTLQSLSRLDKSHIQYMSKIQYKLHSIYFTISFNVGSSLLALECCNI